MNPLNLPFSYPILFWSVGIILSIYYGIRGILIQKHNIANENILKINHNPKLNAWTLTEQIMVHRIHDFLFNSICSISGFVSYFIICKIILGVPDLSKIDSGTAIVISFLSLVAITGVAGVLPHILYYGKVFSK